MRDGKGKFYHLLKVDRFTRKAINVYRTIKYQMMKNVPPKKDKIAR